MDKKITKFVLVVSILSLLLIGVATYAFDNMPTPTITVTTSPTEILPGNSKVRELTLYNRGTHTVNIDNTSLDCISGFPLIGGASIRFNEYRGAIWGATKKGTSYIEAIYLQY